MRTARVATIHPVGPVSGKIQPPGSKSITNRAVICAALALGESRLRGALDSEDTRVMVEAWRQLGVDIEYDADRQEIRCVGTSGKLQADSADLFVGNSGTTVRFLTAALAAFEGNFRLDGVKRMRERPIGDLVQTLEQLGAVIERENPERPDCPPIRIQGRGLLGGTGRINGSISSQFLSGLMMASPLAKEAVHLEVVGELVSVPYVRMTAAVMSSFGVRLDDGRLTQISIPAGQSYVGTDYRIEPDASAASYFWGAAAITGGSATVQGLSRQSLQGDVRFCEVLSEMGCRVNYSDNEIEVVGGPLKGVDVDMSDISDTVQTLAAVALFADGPTNVRGVAHNRVKETDRISDLATELRKLGAEVEEREDGLKIFPPVKVRSTEIATYDDHRMAMSLALVGLRTEGVRIENPGCTAKTYPNYWDDLETFSHCRIGWS